MNQGIERKRPELFPVCFIGSARYSKPLNQTDKRKFEMLSNLGPMFVIGFSNKLRFQVFFEHATFYLTPLFPFPILRQLSVFLGWPFIALWCVFRHKVTCLVCQSPYEGFVGSMVKKVARFFGRKIALIVESHGDFEKSMFLHRQVYFSAAYKWLMQLAAKHALRNSDSCRAISNATKDQLKVWGCHNEVVQFPAWTDIDLFVEAGSDTKVRSSPQVLFAGVLTPIKGTHHLIRAFAAASSNYPSAELIIVGRAENRGYVDELDRLVKQLNLTSRVRFIGEVSQSELARLMAEADLFVLPSLSEGLGRVIFEAMASGKPVISSKVGGIPDIVEDGVTGFLVPPGDEEGLAERLNWALGHPEKLKDMGLQARARVSSIFSTQRYVDSYRQLFQLAMRG